MNNLEKAFDEIRKVEDFRNWEPGDQQVFVFNDAVILITLTEERESNINIIAGEPTRINMDLKLLG